MTMSHGGAVLALDFGGSKHAAALWRPHASRFAAYRRVTAPSEGTADADIAAMVDLARSIQGDDPPAAIGVAFGGPVAADRRTVTRSHHVSGWEHRPLAAELEAALGAPARIENDGNAGALGEHAFGAGRGRAALLYVTVSTGVGGGLVLDGKLWRGSRGTAGEFGHVLADPSGPVCVCGRHGCVESIASGQALAAEARDALQRDPSIAPRLYEHCGHDPTRIDARTLASVAPDEPFAATLLARSGAAIGRAIGAVANLLDPGVALLAGGVTRAGEAFWAPLRCAAQAHMMPEVTCTIQSAALGDDAPLWGAVALACARTGRVT